MRNVLKALFALLVTVFIVSGIAHVMHSKSWYPKMNEFYNHTEDYDVWFLGSSHVIMGTLPEELWNEYGIKSYNLGCFGQSLVMDYWITKNLLNYYQPKLIVIDVGQIATESKYSDDNLGSVRKMVSSIKFSPDKIRMINDIFERDMREEMLFPFSSDHYNWEYLTKDHFVLQESFELGADQNIFGGRGKEDYILVTQTVIPDAIPITEASSIETINSDYLRKLIELCIANEVNVLLVKCPLGASEINLQDYAHGFKIGQEYGVPYFDGFSIIGVFDGDTDMWDKNHLNSLGARKYTRELGKYITEKYPELINNTYSDKTTQERWDSRYDDYLKWLDTELPLQSDCYSYLMLCTHPQYSVIIEMNRNGNAINDDIVWKFIGTMHSCEVIEKENCDFDIGITVYNLDGIEVDEEKFAFSKSDIYEYLKSEK